jgi:hypothetical protein
VASGAKLVSRRRQQGAGASSLGRFRCTRGSVGDRKSIGLTTRCNQRSTALCFMSILVSKLFFEIRDTSNVPRNSGSFSSCAKSRFVASFRYVFSPG